MTPTDRQRGRCNKHGPVTAWTACRHIATGKAEDVILETSDTALCFYCASQLYELDIDDLVLVCEECLKNFIRKLFDHTGTTEKDINKIVVGLEHLRGKA
jgi:hypothetical protein